MFRMVPHRRLVLPALAAWLALLLLCRPVAVSALFSKPSSDTDLSLLPAPGAAGEEGPAPLLVQTAAAAGATAPGGGSWIVLLGDEPPEVSAPETAGAFARRGTRGSGGDAAAGTAAPSAATATAARAAYRARLEARHQALLASAVAAAAGPAGTGAAAGAAGASGPRLTQSFTVAANGFSASGLSPAQAAALASLPSVAAVTRDLPVKAMTHATPGFLGLDGPGKLWEREFGGAAAAAGDVLIGIVDTGISPGALSFEDRATAPGPSVAPPTAGACSEAKTCQGRKLVACRKFNAGLSGDLAAGYKVANFDAQTCTDNFGHGTHVSSTAAGNHGAPAFTDGSAISPHGMSGMAPGAAIAAYKVLWYIADATSGTIVAHQGSYGDIMAGVDAAVGDGADVINLSLGGAPQTFSWQTPYFESLKGAAISGTVVAAAAGNSAYPSTVDNGAPWVLTVAASTRPGLPFATLTLASPANLTAGATLRGIGASSVPAGPAPLYFPAKNASSPAYLCLNGTLNASEAAGKIVVCARGFSARVDKSSEVARAGGAGMVLVNVDGGATTLNFDAHAVPTVHLAASAWPTLLASAAADPGLLATISAMQYDTGAAPSVSSYSSRGPLLTDGGHLLKPDILCPGSEIFAGYPPVEGWNGTGVFMSGTSMATPHASGLAALIKSKRPAWSAAAVRSALVTTANPNDATGRPISAVTIGLSGRVTIGPATPFDMGAGMADANRALDPGLLYDAGADDYNTYTCTVFDKQLWGYQADLVPPQLPGYCQKLCRRRRCKYPQAIWDLNMPSFSLNGLVRGKKYTAERTATYVGDAPSGTEFTPTLTLPPGYEGSVRALKPPRGGGARKGFDKGKLSFSAPGQARGFEIQISVQKDAPGGWKFGSLVWASADGKHSVRSPIALNCIA